MTLIFSPTMQKTKFTEEAHGSTGSAIVTLLQNESMRFVDIEAGFESDAAYLTRMTLLSFFVMGLAL